MSSLRRIVDLAGWLAITAVVSSPFLAAAQSDAPKFEFSGIQRSRYETIDEQFGNGLSGADQVLALQTSLLFDLDLDRLQLVGEIMDSRGELNDEESSVGTFLVNTLEPIQAYAAWKVPDALQDGGTSTLRVGRLTLDIGKRRLISRNRFRNTVSTFAGVDWQWQGAAGQNARAFYLIPMRILPSTFDELLDNDFELDRGARDSELWGGFYQFPKTSRGDTVEVYGFYSDAKGTASDRSGFLDIWSVGTRVFRGAARGRWNYELEAVAQTGTSGGSVAGTQRIDLDHGAHLLHFEVGYQFDAPWVPTLLFQYDDASGDENPLDDRNDRFNTLFGDRRFEFTTTGIYGPFNRSNLRAQGLRLTLVPNPRLQGMLHYRSFRLAAERDTWVGIGARDPTGRAGDSLGRQLEGLITWAAIPDRLTLEAGFEYLWFGRFAHQTGVAAGGDPAYVYFQATTRF